MDYEKKYKEALERAKELHGTVAAGRDFLAEIFPELTESEDERIIEQLLYIVKDYQGYAPKSGLGFKECLTWLEKQKEHQFCSDAPEEKSVGGNFLSSHKDKNLDEIAQDYVDGVKEYNPEPTWDLIQTAVCYGYHYREQKEQKPTDEQFPSLEGLDAIKAKYYDDGFKNGFDEGVESVKPAEWNEEDEHRLKLIRQCIVSCPSISGVDGNEVELLEFLDSLCPQPHTVSIKDATKFGNLEYERGVKDGIQSEKNRHWKPSEEQMSMLLAVIRDPNNAGSESCFLAFKSLYEDLKKL